MGGKGSGRRRADTPPSTPRKYVYKKACPSCGLPKSPQAALCRPCKNISRRKPGRRLPCGALVQQVPCPSCGASKSAQSYQCLACEHRDRRGRSLHQPICACGEKKARYSRRCLACERGERQARSRSIHQCEQCRVTFARDGRHGHRDRPVRFCSNSCANRYHARARGQIAKRRHHEQAIQREFARVLQRELEQRLVFPASDPARRCLCGQPIASGSLCDPCLGIRRQQSDAANWTMERIRGFRHVCPNCGRLFRGRQYMVHCSSKCARQYSKKGRYPDISRLPLRKRNEVAELVALVRAANRAVNEYFDPAELRR